jgi:curved DNA-binding protein CbpA
MINYYEVLGIEPTSTAQEIKRSFRRRAKEIHPDVRATQGSASDDEMRLLLDAYAVLGDLEKRDEYDRALQAALRVRGFDYRSFLRNRVDDPVSQSKLVFHDLLANRQDDALSLYQRLTAQDGFELERYLSREDYMDCAFLLAEEFEVRGRFSEAFQLYRTLYLYERAKPYFHHFIEEVVDRLRTLLCFKMLPVIAPEDAVTRLKELLRLGFSRKDNAFFYKKLAEVYASSGRQDLALHYLQKGLQLDRKLSGVKKLMERLGSPVCVDNP